MKASSYSTVVAGLLNLKIKVDGKHDPCSGQSGKNIEWAKRMPFGSINLCS